MRRYHITLGDSTTVGGKVTSANSNGSINGRCIALEGDLVICPACKFSGKITCVGPRIPETWNGKKVALENDLCMCKCSSPPKLRPSQSLRFQVIESSLSPLATRDAKASSAEDEDEDILEQVFYIHDENNTAVGGFRYDLYINDKIHVSAVELQDGNTIVVQGDSQRLTLVTWPIADESNENV